MTRKQVAWLVLGIIWGIGSLHAARRPNIVFVLADDMGFSDAGCYGGEIATPNLDSLAAGGLRFTQFYNAARCWPSRAALLTGYYPQQVRRDGLPGVKIPGVAMGGSGIRPVWAPLLPERLRPAGYRLYHSGKWHIDGGPVEDGFDRSYDFADHDRYFSPREQYEDDHPLPPVERGSDFYSTTAIADHAIKYLKEHQEKYAARPFFLYVAFISPHFPLQARQEDIEVYRDVYRKGWDVVRHERWERQEMMGLVNNGLPALERNVGPPYDFPDALAKLGPGEINRPLPWNELTARQQAFQAAKMSIHAAMIDRMDREIGRVLAQLKAMGVFDDTLILFASDNGASAEIMVRGDGHDPDAPPGSADSFLCLGPGWSSSSNTPFRRHKTWDHEGGIATPLIVHWPNGIAARGELRTSPSHFIDFVPTVLELADVEPRRVFDGRSAPPLPGQSLVPEFARSGAVTRDFLWWAHEGNRAIRRGDWKLVASGGLDAPWELYDLARDRGESANLAEEQPERVRELQKSWKETFSRFREDALSDLSAASGPVR